MKNPVEIATFIDLSHRIREKMRQYRKKNKIAVKQMDKAMQVGCRTAWARVEYNPDIGLSLKTLVKIATVMNTTVEDLLSPPKD